MWTMRNIQRLGFRTISSLLPYSSYRDILLGNNGAPKMVSSSKSVESSLVGKDCFFSSSPLLKKYELPEVPPPPHDPELSTPEQIQAYEKLDFRNKNCVPVRGFFDRVVQIMHLYWKFHDVVEVWCDNYPREKFKEIAIKLAQLSGGIVLEIHNSNTIKTIIMYRGRNYRQPKNLIPTNIVSKRKALFEARFWRIPDNDKYEQQRIDKKENSPCVLNGENQPAVESDTLEDPEKLSEDSDQEELDRSIAEIDTSPEDYMSDYFFSDEDYINDVDSGDYISNRDEDYGPVVVRGSHLLLRGYHMLYDESGWRGISNGDSEDETAGTSVIHKNDGDDEDEALKSSVDEDWEEKEHDSTSQEDAHKFKQQTLVNVQTTLNVKQQRSERDEKKSFEKNGMAERRGRNARDDSGSENMFGDWDSGDEEEHDSISQGDSDDFMGRSNEEKGHNWNNDWQNGKNSKKH